MTLDSLIIETQREEYSKHPVKCVECGTPFSFDRKHRRFCDTSCSQLHSHRTNPQRAKTWVQEMKRRRRDGTWKTTARKATSRTTIHCKVCEQPVVVVPSDIKRGRKYCSQVCARKDGVGVCYSPDRENANGTHKAGWYAGIYCNSSWELAWVLYQQAHGIDFARNREAFNYVYEGRVHAFYPDFRLGDGSYVEIKGYANDKWQEKKRQFPHALIVLNAAEMRPILDWAIAVHGQDFTRLYNGDTPSNAAKCVVCGSPCGPRGKIVCSNVCRGKHSHAIRKHRP